MKAWVREVMTKDPITIDPEAPLETAAAVMREREVRHLPVVDESGRLIGIITDRDLRGALLAPALAEHLSVATQRRLRGLGSELGNLRVRDAMTWDAVTIGPEAPIARAAALMFEGRISSLPVVERERLVGIVTERDVLRALAATLPAVRGIDPDNYLW
ncbi:MAG TPA: CBS domain-containing protein [Methylomirabilota bacterium]|jgi:CBS domain-containing protein